MSTKTGQRHDREFLFSRNRLNEAISRAQCLALLVENPELLNTRATTIEQMRLVSTLCAAWTERFGEAEGGDPPASPGHHSR